MDQISGGRGKRVAWRSISSAPAAASWLVPRATCIWPGLGAWIVWPTPSLCSHFLAPPPLLATRPRHHVAHRASLETVGRHHHPFRGGQQGFSTSSTRLSGCDARRSLPVRTPSAAMCPISLRTLRCGELNTLSACASFQAPSCSKGRATPETDVGEEVVQAWRVR